MIWIVLPLLLGGLVYSSWGLARLAPEITLLRWGLGGLWLACFVGFVLLFLLRRSISVELMGYLYPLLTSWLIIALYVGMFLVVIDLLRIIPALKPYLQGSWGLLGGFVCVLMLTFVYASWRYEQKERVAIDIKLDKSLSKNYKIVVLSDLHLGYTIGKAELEHWVELINREQADLVLIAGDLVDGDTRPIIAEGLAEVINRIKAPIYACLGNHEYIGNEAEELAFLKKTKVHLLKDSISLIDDVLYIVGRDDRSNPYRQSTAELTKDLDKTKPIIVLDHQPYALEESAKSGVDLHLSGHTHRGQVFPINLLVDKMYRLSHGYMQEGDTHYYVSSGMGIWGGKYRIGTQSEYCVITLRGQQ